MVAVLASLWWPLLGNLVPRAPSVCPYCPGHPEPHWIQWGSYWRSVHDLIDWIRVPRFLCSFTRRTFSLLPDGLLPYRRYRTAVILHHLRALWIEGQASAACARISGVARSTLRSWRSAFALAARTLRLPDHEGALAPQPFLTRVLELGRDAVTKLFARWKELEPKQCVVGIYAR